MLVTVGLTAWVFVEGGKIPGDIELEKISLNDLAQSYPAFATAISTLLYWCYALVVFSIVAIVVGFVWGLVEKPKGLISVGIVTAVAAPIVGVSYWLASKHANMFMPSSDGGKFEGTELMTSEVSLYITYALFALVILATIISVIYSVIRKYI